VTLTLTLREAPAAPVRAEAVCPDRLAGLSRGEVERLEVRHGNRAAALADLFDVSGDGADDVRVEGDGLRRVGGLGVGMVGGRLTVAGDTGADAGAGMRGGEILVHGDAGDEAGAGLRRGVIAVAGRTGAAAGLNALAGTIVALGAVGPHPGPGMRRASIVAMTPPGLLPTYARACTYRPPFLRLFLRRLRELGLPVTDEQIDGRYTRWSGDGLELGRGEILILEPSE
jgi:formylmethanofuran dehydrogenase subunit C